MQEYISEKLELNTDDCCLDNLDFCIIGFTIDVSEIKRENAFDKYFDDKKLTGYKFKRHGSYMSDKEVISTEYGEIIGTINSADAIQLIRFMYILCLSGFHKHFCCGGVIGSILGDSVTSKIVLDSDEKRAVEWLLDNLQEETFVKYEESYYRTIFNQENKKDGNQFHGLKYPNNYLPYNPSKEAVQKLLTNMQKEYFSNEKLYKWMRRESGIDNKVF